MLLSIFWRIWAKLLHSVQKRYTPSPARGVQNWITTSSSIDYDLSCQRCYKFLVHSLIKKRQQIIIKTISLNKPISLWWMCSWAQEEIWKISSNVPRPPGKAMKASAWLNIAFILSDILETCSSSSIVFPMMSPFAKALGTTSKTWLPPKNATINTPRINPRLPPPYTKWIFLSVLRCRGRTK